MLAACGGGGSSGSSGGGGGASGIQVTNLKAIPGNRSLTLTWDNPNANINSFDIDVYDLDTNGTNERVVAASQANITISSNPAVDTIAPLATARYTISSGLVNDSNYSVAVTVNLQGADAGKATSARGLSGRLYLPANGVRIGANTDADQYANVEDNCPAIKNDDQANTYGGADNMGDACGDIDSDTIVDADDNCVDVANMDQLDTIGNGIGDACDSTDDGDGIAKDLDNCPFTANPNQEDGDMDNVGDLCDVDADGDGLIELSTAAELNMMRYNLNGTGLDDGTSDNDNTTGGNSIGCGGNRSGDASACNGYEQMADIDLNDLPSNAIPGNNWEPVGSCTSMPGEFNTNIIECATNAFSGVFSGNNFTISNLLIHITTTRYGVGFFGAISPNAQVHNLHIRGGNINVTETTSQHTGGLVGRGNGATISNSSVTLDALSGGDSVGGLLGQGRDATISSSLATIGSISGAGTVGGLVGYGSPVAIISSVAIVGSIIGTDNRAVSLGGISVGGLVGWGDSATIISSSVATVGSIIGIREVGGLVGYGYLATISSSVATVGSIGTVGIGGAAGLVGYGERAIINSSLAVTNSINGPIDLGGLAGASGFIDFNRDPSNAIASYWDNTTLTPPDTRMLNVSKFGNGQTTAVLTNQISFTGTGNIYATWGDAYCNPNTGEYRATAPSPLGDFVRVWDLGDTDEYPANNCIPTFSPVQQREAARRALAGELPLVD